jgi:hypothetical protein
MRHVLLIFLCLFFAIGALSQEKRGPSTQEERDRAVLIAHKLEANPLDKSLSADASWLLRWSIQVPDLTVSLCASQGEHEKKYKYGPQVTFQKMASGMAFVIEHPDQKDDPVAQELAAVEGAVKAYQAILKADPKGHSEYWDSLLEKQTSGTLKEFVSIYVNSECSGRKSAA